MSSNCVITFDHHNGIYYSGESLNGKIQLITHSPKTVRGVHITINGYAKVKWQTKSGRNKTTYSALDQYLNSRTYVAGQEGGDSFEFPPGSYDYTFYCELPSSLPSSISGKYGEIKYEVILTLDRPFRFDNDFKREFTVIKELNLNNFPALTTPLDATDEKDVSAVCCFGSSGIIKTKLSIPLRGYAPGQQIHFTLEVGNDSDTDLEKCEVRLEQRIICESRQPSVKYKTINFELDRKNFPQVLRKSSKIFEGYMVIPLAPPSSRPDDSCVRVSYILNATIETGSCNRNINLEVPFALGTTPFTETVPLSNPNRTITEQPSSRSIADGDEWVNLLKK